MTHFAPGGFGKRLRNRHRLCLASWPRLVERPCQVMNAMKFVFGPYMVCDTPETAKQITFHPNVRVKTVTKERDSIAHHAGACWFTLIAIFLVLSQ